VEQCIRAVPLENFPDAYRIHNVSHEWDNDTPCAAFDQLLLNLKELHLGTVDEDEQSRRLIQDLPAEFGTDGAACAGHQDDLIADQAPDSGLIKDHRRPAEQVLDLYWPQLSYFHKAFNRLVKRRNSVRRDPYFGCQSRDLAEPRSRSPRHGNNNFPQLRLPFGFTEEFGLSDYRDTMNALIPLQRIIIEKNDGLESQIRLVKELAGHGRSSFPGTHYGC